MLQEYSWGGIFSSGLNLLLFICSLRLDSLWNYPGKYNNGIWSERSGFNGVHMFSCIFGTGAALTAYFPSTCMTGLILSILNAPAFGGTLMNAHSSHTCSDYARVAESQVSEAADTNEGMETEVSVEIFTLIPVNKSNQLHSPANSLWVSSFLSFLLSPVSQFGGENLVYSAKKPCTISNCLNTPGDWVIGSQVPTTPTICCTKPWTYWLSRLSSLKVIPLGHQSKQTKLECQSTVKSNAGTQPDEYEVVYRNPM